MSNETKVPREVVRKAALDAKVAELMGVETRKVSALTAAFLHEVVRALVHTGCARLDGLGLLRVDCRRGVRQAKLTSFKGKSSVVQVRAKYYVNFKKGRALTHAIKAHYNPDPKKEAHHGQVRDRRDR